MELPMENRVNYIEYLLFVSPCGKTAWKTDIGEANFKAALQHFSKFATKANQREYKEICYDDIIYQNHYQEELKVFRLVPITHTEEKGHVQIQYQKQKLSLVNVPSTASPHSIAYVRQLTIRFSNRVFLNFVVKAPASTQKQEYSVYVNYNHDPNVDSAVTKRQLDEIFKIAAQVPIS